MIKEDVILYEKTHTQVNGLYKEMGLLSKKNPNDAVNLFKLRYINQSLNDSNILLGSDYKPYADFDVFEENSTPTTSDVVMILELYLGALHRLKKDNIEGSTFHEYWVIDGEKSNIKA